LFITQYHLTEPTYTNSVARRYISTNNSDVVYAGIWKEQSFETSITTLPRNGRSATELYQLVAIECRRGALTGIEDV